MSNTKGTAESAANEEKKSEIAIIDEQTIRNKIYEVRGMRVMLDFELAEIYGYTTSAFNQQVRRNEDRFPEDFRFQLTQDETEILLSQNVTASWGGDRRKQPWAFSESGIYMLMSVLKGDLAIHQSIALIRTFRAMKDYIIENQDLIGRHDYLRLSMQVSDTQQTVHAIQEQLVDHENRFNSVFEQMSDTVKKSELSPFLLDFSKPEEEKDFLILNGQPAKADETYIDIYSQAKSTVYVVDNYINIKTLRLLQGVSEGVSVTILSDNLRGHLHAYDLEDFRTEFPDIEIDIRKTCNTTHDRFIVLDFDSEDWRLFHCGASSKDAGVRLMTVITELTNEDFKNSFRDVIQKWLGNPRLELR